MFSGVVLIAREGKPVFEHAYGMANMELAVPNTTATKFRIGSISKQFTAAAILLLAEQDKLDVDDLVCWHLAPCPKAWAEVTIEHLLTHHSGIPDPFSIPGFQETLALPTTLDKTVERYAGLPLTFPAGTKFAYSSAGYQVLALIVQRVSGKTYREFMHEKVFEPLGMHDTENDDNEKILPQRAAGYSKSKDGNIINAPLIHMSVPLGAGSMYSTVEDMLRWDNALAASQFLSDRSRAEMFRAHGVADWGDGVGYGWFMGKDKHGHAYAAHAGGINGFGAYVARHPEQKMLLVVLSNYSFAPLEEIARHVEELAMDEDH
jgi:CubicO group peptidase (beta-lactamase class C family)